MHLNPLEFDLGFGLLRYRNLKGEATSNQTESTSLALVPCRDGPSVKGLGKLA